MAAAPSASVYVGDLDPQVTEPLLYDHFKNCGPVVSVRVCIDAQTHKSLGYGYVNFQNPADSENAIEHMNGSKLCTRPIRVARIQRDPTQRKSGITNIVVKHLPDDIDVARMKDIFGKFGKITSVRIAVDEQTGKLRGYAYVMFEKEESAARAVDETNGLEIEGLSIVVERYRPTHRAEMQQQYCNLYIKNLSLDVDEMALRQLFSIYGEIASILIRRDLDNRSKGFGYAAFREHEAAAAALQDLDGNPHEYAAEGQTLVVRRFESRKERLKKKELAWRERQANYAKFPNLYVKNLDDSVTSEQLKEVFEAHGPTQSVRVMVDRETRMSKGFGFVSFKDHSSAGKAISALHGSTLLGSRPLFVAYALKRDVRRAQYEEMQKKRTQRLGMGAPMGGPMGGMGAPMGNYPNQPGLAGYGQPMPLFGMQNVPQHMRPLQQHPQVALQQQLAIQRGLMPMSGMGTAMMPQRVIRPQPKPAVPPQQPQSLASLLANMNVEQQKNVLGERLYNHISRTQPAEAAKITGMLLEMDNSEILNLLEAPAQLDEKVHEALDVLNQHAAGSY